VIDHTKILSFNRDFNTKFFNNPLLKDYSKATFFKNNLDKETRDIKQSTFIKEYREILFCFFIRKDVLTKLEILIKPHYYFNNNLHNANDFTALENIKVFNEIKNTFNLPVKDLFILNIEYGVNGISLIDVKDLISYSLYHEKNQFINSSDDLRFSKISFKHNDNGRANNYKMIKFYAKGIQYPDYCDQNTFRFETKSKRRSFIQTQLDIYTYDDLLKKETYLRLGKSIKEEFNKMLILDVDNEGVNLTSKERSKLFMYSNTIYWDKAIGLSKNTFNNNKKLYYELLDRTGQNLHKSIEKIIHNKLKYLLKDCAILTPTKEINNCADLNVYIIENGTLNKNRKCPVTGYTLSHEKKDAKYIRTSTIKHCRKNDKNMFLYLCSSLLSNFNGNYPKYENNIIKLIAKRVRNRYFNPNKIKRTGYNQKMYPNQLRLTI
jgi:hypothetical protein